MQHGEEAWNMEGKDQNQAYPTKDHTRTDEVMILFLTQMYLYSSIYP